MELKPIKILFLMLVSAFVLLSCDTDPTNENANPLIGTWEDAWVDDDGDPCKDQFIFSADDEAARILRMFSYVSDYYGTTKEPYYENLHGTYQYTKSEIIIIWKSGDYTILPDQTIEFPAEYTADYSINDNTLTLKPHHRNITLTYKKIK